MVLVYGSEWETVPRWGENEPIIKNDYYIYKISSLSKFSCNTISASGRIAFIKKTNDNKYFGGIWKRIPYVLLVAV